MHMRLAVDSVVICEDTIVDNDQECICLRLKFCQVECTTINAVVDTSSSSLLKASGNI